MSVDKQRISLRQVRDLIHSGVTRLTSDKHYNPSLGSIESIYGLAATDVRNLFKHPKLAGLRVKPVVEEPFIIVDDLDDAGYGTPTATAAARLESSIQEEAEEEQNAEMHELNEETDTPQGAENVSEVTF